MSGDATTPDEAQASQALDFDADVIIVGAGPVGLTLANLLGSHGVRTLVLERHADTVGEPRAVSLDDESLRTLQASGLVSEVIRGMVLAYGVQYFSWRGKPFASIQPTRQEYGYPKRNAFRQQLLEATLRDGVKRFAKVRLCFNTELRDFTQDAQAVICRASGPQGVEFSLRGRWLVGCDGGRSRVRDLCGIALEGDTFAQRWLIVDMQQRTTALRHTQTFCDPARPAIRLPGPHATLRYEFMLRPHEDDAFALDETRFRGWMAARCPQDRDLPVVRKVVYTFHARVADRWRDGRVLLAGDAAHLTPPFAGQGLNSGLRDAANLAWKLAAVTRWGAPDTLLATYEMERRPHAAALIRMALRIGHFMQPANRMQAALSQGLLRAVCLIPAARDYLLQLRFKPKPQLNKGYFVPPAGSRARSELLPQPMMDLPDRSLQRLDELLGPGFAVIGFDSDVLRQQAWQWVPAGVPSRVVALIRADQDFVGAHRSDADVTLARDGSGALEAVLDRLQVHALVVRPDRYWSRAMRYDGQTDGEVAGWHWPDASAPARTGTAGPVSA